VNGQAVVHLDQGSYELNVQARGFQTEIEKQVEVREEIRKTFTLKIGPFYSGPEVMMEAEIPFEHLPLQAQIPLMPIEQFTLTAKRPRQKQR
jgi:hypothetical protein